MKLPGLKDSSASALIGFITAQTFFLSSSALQL
jgi:hypothetical protein